MSSVRFGYHANNLGFGFGYNRTDNRTEFVSVNRTEPMLGSVNRNETGAAYLDQKIHFFFLVITYRQSLLVRFNIFLGFKALTFQTHQSFLRLVCQVLNF